MIGTGLPEATTLDVSRTKWYIVSRYDKDVVPALSGASAPRARASFTRSATGVTHDRLQASLAKKLLPRWVQAWCG